MSLDFVERPESEAKPMFVWPLSRNYNMIVFDTFLYSPTEVYREANHSIFDVSPAEEYYEDGPDTSKATSINIPKLNNTEMPEAGVNYVRLTYPDGVISQLMYTTHNRDKYV